MVPRFSLPPSSLPNTAAFAGAQRYDLPVSLVEKLDLTQLLKEYEPSIKKNDMKPLAEAIQKKIDQQLGQNYEFANVANISPPYAAQEVNETIGLDPFAVLANERNISHMILLRKNEAGEVEIQLFTKNERGEVYQVSSKGEQLLDDNQQTPFTKQWSAAASKPEFVLFYSSSQSVHHLTAQEQKISGENTAWKFFHYQPRNSIPIKREAPFHHEAQPSASSGLCGFHALNAFVGCRQFSPREVGDKVVNLFQFQYSLAREEAQREVFATREDGTIDDENFNGLDVTALRYVIDEIAKSGSIPIINSLTKLFICRGATKVGEQVPKSTFGDPIDSHIETLTAAFNKTDRFILGLSVTDAHFLTYRKDEEGKWWRLDSELGQQVSFANARDLLEQIKKDYPNPYILNFIIPDSDQVVMNKKPPPPLV